MNKKFKNILIISIFIFVGCFSLYSISSCCVIFTDFNLDINHLLNNVFATRDAENFILFKSGLVLFGNNLSIGFILIMILNAISIILAALLKKLELISLTTNANLLLVKYHLK